MAAEPDEGHDPSAGLPEALRGLLGKLTRDVGDLRFGPMLRALQSEDFGEQVNALSELCDTLSMASEDTLAISGFRAEQFLPVLVPLISVEAIPDVPLLAARALTHMIDLQPPAAGAATRLGAVEALCGKLMAIEFMDVAEQVGCHTQAMQALDKIAVAYPTPVLRAGGVGALLAFLDFFPTSVQRTAARAAASACKGAPADCAQTAVRDAVPALSNLLQYPDAKIAASAVGAFLSLARAFAEQGAPAESFELLAAHGLVSEAMRLLHDGAPQTPQLLQLLQLLTRHAPALALTVLEGGVAGVLQRLLLGAAADDAAPPGTPGTPGTPYRSPTRMPQPAQQLSDALELAAELLPPMDDAGDGDESDEAATPDRLPPPLSLEGDAVEPGPARSQSVASTPKSQPPPPPAAIQQFGTALLPACLDVHASAVNPALRDRAVLVVHKLLFWAPADELRAVLAEATGGPAAVAGLVAALISASELRTVLTAVRMAALLMRKLPDEAREPLLREGVVSAVEELLADDLLPPPMLHPGLARANTLDEEASSPPPPASPFLVRAQSTGRFAVAAALQVRIADAARELRDEHFPAPPADQQPPASPTDDAGPGPAPRLRRQDSLTLRELSAACDQSPPDFARVGQLLVAPDGVSTFEFVTSGVMSAVLRHLRSGGGGELQLPEEQRHALVGRVQAVLAAREAFELQLSDVSGIAAGVAQLGNPLRLRLVADEAADAELAGAVAAGGLDDLVVLIEPLAAPSAVEDYLLGKLTSAGLIGSGGDDDDDVFDGVTCDGCGQSPLVGVRHKCRACPDYDLCTGCMEAGTHSQHPFRDLRKVGADRLDLGLTRGDTILQALSDAACPTRELWGDVHTVRYRRGAPAAAPPAAGDDDDGGDTEEDELEVRRRDDDLLPHPGWAAAAVDASDPTFEALALLRQLRRRFPADPPELFENGKVASKLQLQLTDVLAVAGGVMPAWAHHLMHAAPFLFPLAVRELYLGAAAFGTVRAVQRLQRLLAERGAGAAARASQARVAPIQRLKLRVARHRVLDSACRVLEAYGGAKSIIEVEFLGEVGTGLGPTVEFYALVSRELQRADLGLWRSEPVSVSGEEEEEEDEEEAADEPQPQPMPGFHRVAVVTCQGCGDLRVPSCAAHGALLTGDDQADAAHCHANGCATAAAAGECSVCGQQQQLRWWVVSDEETEYLEGAFPRTAPAALHPLLVCPHCSVVNFPGTEDALLHVRADDGAMVTSDGRRTAERSYRAVTRHLSALCSNAPLRQVDVSLRPAAVDALCRLGPATPDAAEDPALAAMAAPPRSGRARAFVVAPHGLFPAPGGSATDLFEVLGRLIAQALLDDRLLDLPLSPALLAAVQGERVDTLEWLAVVEPEVARSLAAVERASPEELEAMMLEFDDGRGPVTAANAREYVRATLDRLLGGGVRRQVEAVRAGLAAAMAPHWLAPFAPQELLGMLCGSDATWPDDPAALLALLRCDHGYTRDSAPVRALAEAMAGMDRKQQEAFLAFATGSPRLPVGGLAELRPRLTVVRKHTEPGESPDGHLPSASTCTNYLKLPAYSSREVLEERLQMAVTEGAGAFHLS